MITLEPKSNCYLSSFVRKWRIIFHKMPRLFDFFKTRKALSSSVLVRTTTTWYNVI